MKKILYLLMLAVFVFSCSSDKAVIVKDTADKDKQISKKTEKPMKAIIETSMGTIEVELFTDKAPITVENFVGLATGTKEFTDLKTGKKTKKKFYDGLTFHRVIPEFMIQGGCPLGTGTGGPGYTFEDETNNGLKFNKPGLLAMANAGPNTNGSQFFITEVTTPWLNGHHTIFGQVVSMEDLEVVKKIARVETGFSNDPIEPVIINKITIEK
jgi:peptidyl-prolyl cis-trans isomerase A (cyclophilin A)